MTVSSPTVAATLTPGAFDNMVAMAGIMANTCRLAGTSGYRSMLCRLGTP